MWIWLLKKGGRDAQCNAALTLPRQTSTQEMLIIFRIWAKAPCWYSAREGAQTRAAFSNTRPSPASFIKLPMLQHLRLKEGSWKKRFPIWESWKVDLSHLLNCCPCLGASSVAHWRLNLSINSCWLQTRPRSSLNIMFFEWFLCCAYWNSNYCGYHFKNIAPLTFFDRWKLGIFSKGL